jgi:hypothetical protein
MSSSAVRRARLGVAATFFLTGAVFATWAARVPAIKHDLGLGDGQLALAFVGLNAGAIVGLQVGGVLIPRVGSRPALRVALPGFAATLVALAFAPNLPLLTAALVLSAAANGVVDVGMNAHGVAVERHYGRPILSGLHAMHPLGGIVGAGAGALAARLGLGTAAHFLVVAAAVAAAAVVATGRLLPASVDASASERAGRRPAAALAEWLGGWSRWTAALGGLAFCVTLAEGAALDWGAVYLRDIGGASPSLAAVGVAVFLGGITLGRLGGDGLIRRFGPVAAFRAGGLVGGAGFGGALLVGTPVAGILGLGLLGAGISYLLPLLLGAGGRRATEAAAAAAIVARVSTLGYLGSFVGPALIGALAEVVGLPLALAVPALLVVAAALGAGVAASSPD